MRSLITAPALLCLGITLLLSACANKDTPSEVPIGVTEESAGPPVTPAPEPDNDKPSGTIFTRAARSLGNLLPGRREKVPEALPARSIGSVKQVNTPNRFVLIDAPQSASLKPGAELITVREASRTATLRLTALRSSSFLIADITEGSPESGDRVFVP